MITVSSILKSFLMKLYVFVIIFLLVFGIGSLYNFITNRPSLIDRGSYVSVGEIKVTSNSVDTNDNLDTYLSNVIASSKGTGFTTYVHNEIEKEMKNPTGVFAPLTLTEQDKNAISKVTISDLKANIQVEVKDKTTILVIKYSDKNSAAVAQAINIVIVNSMYSIMQNDTDNLLGGIIDKDDVRLSYNIKESPNLPKDLTTNKTVNNNSVNMTKVAIISALLYIIYVVIVDYVLGFITTKQKARAMVKANVISEIQIPYFSNRKKKEDM